MKFLLVLFLLVLSLQAQKPNLFLLKNYTDDTNVTSWYMSEKLDGVRAYWDGKKLISRSGKVFIAPEFFTKDFPDFELDGELWTKRDDFSNIVSIVNTKTPHSGWNKLTYNVFEVPNAKGNLLQRLAKLKNNKSPFIKVIEQTKIKSKKHLQQFHQEIKDLKGEGVVVRDANVAYYTGRESSALKVKSYKDAECTVVGYNNGNGKYDGMIGSLSCRMKDNRVIKIGSGLSDKLRTIPPVLGTVVTFKYYGLTSKGKPRFPVFMRVRDE